MLRQAVVLGLILLGAACGTTGPAPDDSEFATAPGFIQKEIQERIAAMPYQSGEVLYQSLLRLTYIGEPAIPFLLEGLSGDHPRTRGSCAWVLGVLKDRRTIEPLRRHLDDEAPEVRYEVANSLCALGDPAGYPVLIAGLSDPSIRNRYKAHESLKLLTGLDFGYRHDDPPEKRRLAVRKWKEWWEGMKRSRL